MDDNNKGKDAGRQKRLDERVSRIIEGRRRKFLQVAPPNVLSTVLEGAKTPVVIFQDYKIIYANPAAIRETGYNYLQIQTFNNMELDTGREKKRVDYVMRASGKLGLNAIEFETSIPTLDRKILEMNPHMHRVVEEDGEYWVSELRNVRKTDPASITTRVLGWLQRLFQRDGVISIKAPELVYHDYIGKEILKKLADPRNNVLIDFSQTKYIDDKAVAELINYASNEIFGKQLFITTSRPEQYHWLRFKKVPESHLYLPKAPQIDIAKA